MPREPWHGLAPRRQAVVHLTLFGLAALTLPISLIGATPPPDANVFIWVPWLLLVSIGPLFLVVSAQAPRIAASSPARIASSSRVAGLSARGRSVSGTSVTSGTDFSARWLILFAPPCESPHP